MKDVLTKDEAKVRTISDDKREYESEKENTLKGNSSMVKAVNPFKKVLNLLSGKKTEEKKASLKDEKKPAGKESFAKIRKNMNELLKDMKNETNEKKLAVLVKDFAENYADMKNDYGKKPFLAQTLTADGWKESSFLAHAGEKLITAIGPEMAAKFGILSDSSRKLDQKMDELGQEKTSSNKESERVRVEIDLDDEKEKELCLDFNKDTAPVLRLEEVMAR